MKLTKIILEQDDLFVPRRSQEDRDKARLIQINRYIQEYMKNGSKGDLELNDTSITSLPKELTHVQGNLYLMSSAIQKLPEGLKVDGSLYLNVTPINSLPKRLKVEDSLYLSFTFIKSLPEDLEVDGFLDISDTPLTSLPKGFKTKSSLNLSGTLIESLPEDIEVRGTLFVQRTPLAKRYNKAEIAVMYPGIQGKVVT